MNGEHYHDTGRQQSRIMVVRRYPYVTFILIGICVAAFIAQQYSVDFTLNLFMRPDPVFLKPWMFVTSIFLHGSMMHLLFNMIVLFSFGAILEHGIGSKRFLLIFILSGIAGNIGYWAFSHATGDFTPSLGASGAVYGVLGCLAILAPQTKIYLMFMIPLNIVYGIILFAMIDILFLFNEASNVAHSAHLAGLLIGLAYAMNLKRRWIAENKFAPALIIFMIAVIIASVTAIQGNAKLGIGMQNMSDQEINVLVYLDGNEAINITLAPGEIGFWELDEVSSAGLTVEHSLDTNTWSLPGTWSDGDHVDIFIAQDGTVSYFVP